MSHHHDFMEILMKDAATKDIPILVVTAQAMTEDKERAIQAGADGFTSKPVDIGKLKNEVARLLGARV